MRQKLVAVGRCLNRFEHSTQRKRMNAKHTPGPWTYGRQAGRRGFTVYLGSNRQSADDEIYVGTLGGSDEIVATDEANARLLASSPRLLAALESMLEQADLGEIHDDETRAVVDEARLAVAEAKGITR